MLPSNTVIRLSDHFGHYVIDVKCRHCQHAREVTPHALARIFGWNAELSQVAQRFRCSKCNGRNVDVQVAFDRKPRRWGKDRR